jgi:hypothetical protein
LQTSEFPLEIPRSQNATFNTQARCVSYLG